jgi:methionyl aminopeptidase
MEEGKLPACETFGTTGKGTVHATGEGVSHFMVSRNPPVRRTPQQRKLLKTLQDNFSTLAFCPRFIDCIGERKYRKNLWQLSELKAIVECPALTDVKGS